MGNFSVTGSTSRTQKFLQRMQTPGALTTGLDALARRGVAALQAATPADSGLTGSSWGYEIERKGDVTTIWWINTNTVDGTNIAVILQFGHATGTGGYVAGYDYINPALKPIFDELANEVWKKVTSA